MASSCTRFSTVQTGSRTDQRRNSLCFFRSICLALFCLVLSNFQSVLVACSSSTDLPLAPLSDLLTPSPGNPFAPKAFQHSGAQRVRNLAGNEPHNHLLRSRVGRDGRYEQHESQGHLASTEESGKALQAPRVSDEFKQRPRDVASSPASPGLTSWTSAAAAATSTGAVTPQEIAHQGFVRVDGYSPRSHKQNVRRSRKISATSPMLYSETGTRTGYREDVPIPHAAASEPTSQQENVTGLRNTYRERHRSPHSHRRTNDTSEREGSFSWAAAPSNSSSHASPTGDVFERFIKSVREELGLSGQREIKDQVLEQRQPSALSTASAFPSSSPLQQQQDQPGNRLLEILTRRISPSDPPSGYSSSAADKADTLLEGTSSADGKSDWFPSVHDFNPFASIPGRMRDAFSRAAAAATPCSSPSAAATETCSNGLRKKQYLEQSVDLPAKSEVLVEEKNASLFSAVAQPQIDASVVTGRSSKMTQTDWSFSSSHPRPDCACTLLSGKLRCASDSSDVQTEGQRQSAAAENSAGTTSTGTAAAAHTGSAGGDYSCGVLGGNERLSSSFWVKQSPKTLERELTMGAVNVDLQDAVTTPEERETTPEERDTTPEERDSTPEERDSTPKSSVSLDESFSPTLDGIQSPAAAVVASISPWPFFPSPMVVHENFSFSTTAAGHLSPDGYEPAASAYYAAVLNSTMGSVGSAPAGLADDRHASSGEPSRVPAAHPYAPPLHGREVPAVDDGDRVPFYGDTGESNAAGAASPGFLDERGWPLPSTNRPPVVHAAPETADLALNPAADPFTPSGCQGAAALASTTAEGAHFALLSAASSPAAPSFTHYPVETPQFSATAMRPPPGLPPRPRYLFPPSVCLSNAVFVPAFLQASSFRWHPAVVTLSPNAAQGSLAHRPAATAFSASVDEQTEDTKEVIEDEEEETEDDEEETEDMEEETEVEEKEGPKYTGATARRLGFWGGLPSVMGANAAATLVTIGRIQPTSAWSVSKGSEATAAFQKAAAATPFVDCRGGAGNTTAKVAGGTTCRRLKNDGAEEQQSGGGPRTPAKSIADVNEHPADIVGMLFIAIASAIAVAAGAGGGAIYVPILILVMQFTPYEAVATSQALIFGGSLAGTILNFFRRNPRCPDRPVIDIELVLLMGPMQIAGATVGLVVNRCLPTYIILGLLVVLLLFVSYKTLLQARRLKRKSREVALETSLEGADSLTMLKDDDGDLAAKRQEAPRRQAEKGEEGAENEIGGEGQEKEAVKGGGQAEEERQKARPEGKQQQQLETDRGMEGRRAGEEDGERVQSEQQHQSELQLLDGRKEKQPPEEEDEGKQHTMKGEEHPQRSNERAVETQHEGLQSQKAGLQQHLPLQKSTSYLGNALLPQRHAAAANAWTTAGVEPVAASSFRGAGSATEEDQDVVVDGHTPVAEGVVALYCDSGSGDNGGRGTNRESSSIQNRSSRFCTVSAHALVREIAYWRQKEKQRSCHFLAALEKLSTTVEREQERREAKLFRSDAIAAAAFHQGAETAGCRTAETLQNDGRAPQPTPAVWAGEEKPAQERGRTSAVIVASAAAQNGDTERRFKGNGAAGDATIKAAALLETRGAEEEEEESKKALPIFVRSTCCTTRSHWEDTEEPPEQVVRGAGGSATERERQGHTRRHGGGRCFAALDFLRTRTKGHSGKKWGVLLVVYGMNLLLTFLKGGPRRSPLQIVRYCSGGYWALYAGGVVLLACCSYGIGVFFCRRHGAQVASAVPPAGAAPVCGGVISSASAAAAPAAGTSCASIAAATAHPCTSAAAGAARAPVVTCPLSTTAATTDDRASVSGALPGNHQNATQAQGIGSGTRDDNNEQQGRQGEPAATAKATQNSAASDVKRQQRRRLLWRKRTKRQICDDICYTYTTVHELLGLSFMAGLMAGLVGIGGGLLLGPVLLSKGVHPTVSAAVNSTLILFTSSSAAALSISSAAAPLDYSLLFFGICFASTLSGKALVDTLVKKYHASYVLVILLLTIMVCSVCFSIASGVMNLVKGNPQDFKFKLPCD